MKKATFLIDIKYLLLRNRWTVWICLLLAVGYTVFKNNFTTHVNAQQCVKLVPRITLEELTGASERTLAHDVCLLGNMSEGSSDQPDACWITNLGGNQWSLKQNTAGNTRCKAICMDWN